MEFTKEEIAALKYATDESHSDYVFRNNVIEMFSQFIKEPLFTTEDGVDIWSGDKAYYLSDENKIWNHTFDVAPKWKTFSTEAAAQEYLDTQVPLYTKQQLVEAVENWAMISPGAENIINFLNKEE